MIFHLPMFKIPVPANAILFFLGTMSVAVGDKTTDGPPTRTFDLCLYPSPFFTARHAIKGKWVVISALYSDRLTLGRSSPNIYWVGRHGSVSLGVYICVACAHVGLRWLSLFVCCCCIVFFLFFRLLTAGIKLCWGSFGLLSFFYANVLEEEA